MRSAVAELGSDPTERQWLERHLRPLAGVAEEEPAGSAEGVAAWRRFLEALAEELPLVLVFEDLHWADDALLEFVDQLVERVSGVPLLVLATARPELLERRPGWGGGKPNALAISLSPLSDDETARLVQELLERPLLDAQTQEALLSRAEGNPLYAEQYARMLGERGDLLELPETIQGIIAARLDALSEDEKRLLQDAAVVGKVFWVGALTALDGSTGPEAEERLFGLERKEFVQRARNSSVAGESEYAFRHLLIRDIAYGQIPRAARSHKHERAAAWIVSLGRPDDQAEMLAHHYLQALELADAAGIEASALADSARHALRDAGDRAASLFALEAAERFYEAALQLWPEDDPERAQLLFRRAAPVSMLDPGDPERLEQARDALLAAGDDAKAGEAEMLIGQRFWFQGRRDLADEHSRRAAELLAETPPGRSTAWVLSRRSTLASLGGDEELSIELASQALAQAERLDWEEGIVSALSPLGVSRVCLGDRGGLDDLQRGIEIATAAGALGSLSRTYNNLAVARVFLGELEAAFDSRLKALRVAEQIGSAFDLRWYQGVMTEEYYRRGDWDEASRRIDEFLAPVEAGSPHYVAYQAYSIRAEIRLGRGDQAGAIRDVEKALELGRIAADVQALFYALATGANVFSLASERGRALILARELIESLSRGVGMQFAVIKLATFAATALRLDLGHELVDALAGNPETPWTDAARAYVQGDFAAAAEILQRISSRPDEAEARLRAAEQLMGEGARPEANGQLHQALELYRSMGSTRYVNECEALLAASA